MLDHREVIGTPQEVYGPYWALVERRGKEQGRGRALPSPIQIGVGARPPFLLPLSSFLPLLLQLGKGGILLPVGVGLLLGRAIERAGPPLLHSFIYGEGVPLGDTTIDRLIF